MLIGRKKQRPISGASNPNLFSNYATYKPPKKGDYDAKEVEPITYQPPKVRKEQLDEIQGQNYRAKHIAQAVRNNMKYNKIYGNHKDIKAKEDKKGGGEMGSAIGTYLEEVVATKKNNRFANPFGAKEAAERMFVNEWDEPDFKHNFWAKDNANMKAAAEQSKLNGEYRDIFKRILSRLSTRQLANDAAAYGQGIYGPEEEPLPNEDYENMFRAFLHRRGEENEKFIKENGDPREYEREMEAEEERQHQFDEEILRVEREIEERRQHLHHKVLALQRRRGFQDPYQDTEHDVFAMEPHGGIDDRAYFGVMTPNLRELEDELREQLREHNFQISKLKKLFSSDPREREQYLEGRRRRGHGSGAASASAAAGGGEESPLSKYTGVYRKKSLDKSLEQISENKEHAKGRAGRKPQYKTNVPFKKEGDDDVFGEGGGDY
jgi:hypothetical protein